MDHAPPQISDAKVAASLEGAHYAINFINKVKLTQTSRVLVNGATGAIGSAALQLLKREQIYVEVVGNTKNMQLLRRQGADKVYNYEVEDFTEIAPGGFDFVFDAVGKSSFAQCKKLLKSKGIYISSELGPNNQNPFLALWTPLIGGKKVVFPFPSNIKRSMTIIKDGLQDGTFDPVIDRHYNFADIADAYRYTLSGQKTGNVVVEMSGV